MYNHARTLLLNAEGSSTVLGEEPIPTEYRSVILTSPLQTVRGILFGSLPDRLMLNYRARQLLPFIHSVDLLEFVTALDPRITYEFDDTPFLDSSLYQPVIKQIAGTTAVTPVVTGDPAIPDTRGRMLWEWYIEVTGSSEVSIAIDGYRTVLAYTVDAGGLSSPVQLPGGVTNQVILTQPAVGQTWRVSWMLRPQWTPGQLHARLKSLPETLFVELFRVTETAGRTEPWPTFRNLWSDHPEMPYALGGLLLGFIYHTELLRVRGTS